MTKKDRKKLARGMLKNLTAAFMASVEHCPDDWDGFELRALLGEHAQKFGPNMIRHDRARANKFDRVIATNRKVMP